MRIKNRDVVSVVGMLEKLNEFGATLLCAGPRARWVVIAAADEGTTEMYFLHRDLFGEFGAADTMVCAGAISFGMSMGETPLRVLRDAVSDNFGEMIKALESKGRRT